MQDKKRQVHVDSAVSIAKAVEKRMVDNFSELFETEFESIGQVIEEGVYLHNFWDIGYDDDEVNTLYSLMYDEFVMSKGDPSQLNKSYIKMNDYHQFASMLKIEIDWQDTGYFGSRNGIPFPILEVTGINYKVNLVGSNDKFGGFTTLDSVRKWSMVNLDFKGLLDESKVPESDKHQIYYIKMFKPEVTQDIWGEVIIDFDMDVNAPEFTKIKDKVGISGLTVKLSDSDSNMEIKTAYELDPKRHVIIPEDLQAPQGKRVWGIDMYEETKNLLTTDLQ
ncbi:hypothetical protein DID75_01070 [Candidatus Marinamargulisbacteria bacterium SCGC AG-410-N11]|nr:hypothetical protein DID75_01070 [Candidatus Marinamargulisbacteria bacterium SCGC AG-410-N11]